MQKTFLRFSKRSLLNILFFERMFSSVYNDYFLLEPFLGILDIENNLYSSKNSSQFSEKYKD